MDGAVRGRALETLEMKVLGIAGGGLLALALFFLWRELQVPLLMVLLAGTAVAALVAGLLLKFKVPIVGPLVLLGALVGAGMAYGASREPIALAALGVVFVASLVFAGLGFASQTPGSTAARVHRLLSWHGAAVAGLVTTLALYFHLFDASDLGLQGFVARRALLSLLWLSSGAAMVLLGRKQGATEIRDAGFLVLGVAMVKMLLFDTTHLDGFTRVASLAVGGLLLLASAVIVRRFHSQVA